MIYIIYNIFIIDLVIVEKKEFLNLPYNIADFNL